jgi:hypothetical protein
MRREGVRHVHAASLPALAGMTEACFPNETYVRLVSPRGLRVATLIARRARFVNKLNSLTFLEFERPEQNLFESEYYESQNLSSTGRDVLT